jgi:hypothetical protein
MILSKLFCSIIREENQANEFGGNSDFKRFILFTFKIINAMYRQLESTFNNTYD